MATRIRAVVVAVVAAGLTSTPAMAQDADTIEVTPYVAVGTAGASPLGVAVTLPISSIFSAETDVAYRRGEGSLNALSTNVSLLWHLPNIGQASPYVAGGVGLAQYGTAVLAQNGPPVGTQSRLAMTVNGGGGLKIPVGNTVDLRTDARWFKSVGSQGIDHFRIAQGLSFSVRKK